MMPQTSYRRAAKARRLFGPCTWGLWVLLGAAQLAAVAGAQAQGTSLANPSEQRRFGPSGDAALDARAQQLGRKLRCPVCQGMPIAESPATMAIDMMRQVRKMLAAGQSDAAIVDYFTSRYGQWVLLEPPHEGFALWVWILPPLVALGLLAVATGLVWRRRPGAAGASQNACVPISAEAPGVAEQDAEALLATIRREVEL